MFEGVDSQTTTHSSVVTVDDEFVVSRVEVALVAWRREKVLEILGDTIDLPEPEKSRLCQLLMDHHKAFSLEEDEREETDLVQLEINTGDATPKRQHPRRIFFFGSLSSPGDGIVRITLLTQVRKERKEIWASNLVPRDWESSTLGTRPLPRTKVYLPILSYVLPVVVGGCHLLSLRKCHDK